MGGSLPGGAVAEERDCDLAGAAELRGQRGAARVRDPCTDDPVAAEDVQGEIRDVHRAPEARAVPGPLPEHLGHHPAEVRARGDEMTVRPMVADEVVSLLHHACGADGDRLLADAAVRRSEDDPLLEQLRGAILEAADERHAPVLLEQRWPVRRPCVDAHRGGRSWSSNTYPSGSSA